MGAAEIFTEGDSASKAVASKLEHYGTLAGLVFTSTRDLRTNSQSSLISFQIEQSVHSSSHQTLLWVHLVRRRSRTNVALFWIRLTNAVLQL